VGLDVAGVHPTDTAAAQYCETDHYSPLEASLNRILNAPSPRRREGN
jgi:hypothetical protein